MRNIPVSTILPLEPEFDGFFRQWSLCLKDQDATAAEDHAADLRRALRESPWEIRRMARNALMLSALAVVHYHTERLPERRAEL